MNLQSLDTIIKDLSAAPRLAEHDISRIFRKNLSPEGTIYTKSEVLTYYNSIFTKSDLDLSLQPSQKANFLNNIKMKKVRTLSGVTTVTVLTKPFACPGKCIFCPNDVRMPKSYISSEPGAQRAKTNNFDPFAQTYNRLLALQNIGHETDKVELIVLGGTWTSYPESYQIWFIKRCFDAMNTFSFQNTNKEFVKFSNTQDEYNFNEIKDENGKINYNLSVSLDSKKAKDEKATWEELYEVHKLNITAKARCVGLSIETRPDEINEKQVEKIRRLGATKVQIGVQSLNDKVLLMNKRGHDVNQTAYAFEVLRSFGFKIQAHYMPNLYGATPKSDIADFKKLFTDKRFRPDELKIYPCSLIDGTELMEYFKAKKWSPYNKEELTHVLVECLKSVPRYCRVTRVIRDIPSTEIIEGNKLTNLRQLVENMLESQEVKISEIRSREVKGKNINRTDLYIKQNKYQTATSDETFIEYIDKKDNIAGFLRLSFPIMSSYLKELNNAAIIREVHVYGQSLQLGKESNAAPQHSGIGTDMINTAIKLAIKNKFKKIAVISSIGTIKYYEKFGFKQGGLYQTLKLTK